MATDPSADDLLTLLAVARLGRFTAAAEVLEVNHTTVARRVQGLEKILGGRLLVPTSDGWELTEAGSRVVTAAEQIERAMLELRSGGADSPTLSGTLRLAGPDGFSTHYAMPAAVRMQADHPQCQFEVIAATQRLRQQRSGVDIEVVVGKPSVHRGTSVHLADYRLRLYATENYLARHGTITELGQLTQHTLAYYIESALQVDELDAASRTLPAPRSFLRSTSVFGHLHATLASGAIGLLPEFMAARHRGTLVPVLHEKFSHPASFWAVIGTESERNPAVAVMMQAIHQVLAEDQPHVRPPVRR